MKADRSNDGARAWRTTDGEVVGDGGGDRDPSLDAIRAAPAMTFRAIERPSAASGARTALRDEEAGSGRAVMSGDTITAGVAVSTPKAGVMATLAGSGGAAPSVWTTASIAAGMTPASIAAGAAPSSRGAGAAGWISNGTYISRLVSSPR